MQPTGVPITDAGPTTPLGPWVRGRVVDDRQHAFILYLASKSIPEEEICRLTAWSSYTVSRYIDAASEFEVIHGDPEFEARFLQRDTIGNGVIIIGSEKKNNFRGAESGVKKLPSRNSATGKTGITRQSFVKERSSGRTVKAGATQQNGVKEGSARRAAKAGATHQWPQAHAPAGAGPVPDNFIDMFLSHGNQKRWTGAFVQAGITEESFREVMALSKYPDRFHALLLGGFPTMSPIDRNLVGDQITEFTKNKFADFTVNNS
ncbi:hypothetical protein C8J57DRAFT_1530943 [Mycena rebaudengoi]|nr:hypothetical protein C8J57DRAFT_1530943 [Mycena rebaudengoi]